MLLKDFLLTDLSPIMEILNKLEVLMASADQVQMELLLLEYQKTSDQFEMLGGYTALEKEKTY